MLTCASVFIRRCKLPDMSAKDSFNCACGDKAFKIVPERRLDSWVNQGFWCSTTMTMMNYDGNTKYVWNPYTLAELEQVLLAVGSSGKTKLDDYLHCVATGGTCTPPSTPVFDRQQVSDEVDVARDGGPEVLFGE